MNKIITAVLAVIIVAVGNAQAVSLNWASNASNSKMLNTTGGAMTTGVGSETASITAYYILASDYGTVAGITDQSTISGTYAKASAAGQTASSTSASGRFAGSLPTILNSSSGVEYFARVYATMGGTAYYMDLKDGGTSAYWKTLKDGDNTVTESLGWTAATYGGATGVAGDFNKWVAVPEPTSMALFGIGAAVLGLRRRFKKKA